MPMKIDFVSDVACPWCAVGLASLEQAIARLDVPVELHVEPFELNPGMGPEGEDLVGYLGRKYGSTPQQIIERQALIRSRGAEVGFAFGPRTRVYDTFNAHRLLHWAAGDGRALELKRLLLAAYHGRGENPGARDVLLRAAGEAGLDAGRAAEVFDSGRYADEVRQRVAHWQRLGINSVPSVVVDDRHLIQGGQPVEVFERALREIVGNAAA